MAEVYHEDPVMPRVRDWLKESGLTMHELGLRMGYGEATARKSVSQFLKSADPRIGMLRKFAAAAGIPIEDLVGAVKVKQSKK
jgi:transcriptional regulator with XRE-family HTH domain